MSADSIRQACCMAALATAIVLAPSSAALAAYLEAPSLDQKVKTGALPPVDQRVPEKPDLIGDREVGTYGGELRRGLRGSSDQNAILKIVGAQGLVRWTVDYTAVMPNVAERYDVSPDATRYTFHLRKGMKWSDGQPFDVDDVAFFFEDLMPNPEFYKAAPARYTVGGQPVKFEKIDGETFRLTFAKPYGLFLQELATPLGQEPTLWAKHYCKQFVPKYNPAIADLVKKEGAADWAALFRSKCGDIEIASRWGNPDRPTLDPWIMTKEAYGGGATRVVMERNPYFWQVDQKGQQLPYLDRLVMGIAQDAESLLLEAVAGKIDFQDRHINTTGNKPVLIRSAEKGGYRLVNMRSAGSNRMGIFPNLTHKDPVMRDLLNNHDVRAALSLAIDRQEINEVVYLGQGQPRQIGPFKGTPLYNEKLATQYTVSDPETANAMLDRLGFIKRDGNGIRLMPDGRKLGLQVNVIPNLAPEWVDVLELIKSHWQKVGVDLTINVLERSIFYQRADAVDFDAIVWSVSGGSGLDVYMSPREVIAVHPQGTWQAIPWATWYNSGGKAGSEPNASMKKRLALWDEFKTKANPADQEAVFKQILAEAADAFEVIGIVSEPTPYIVVNNRLRNVPDGVITDAWTYGNPGPALPQVFYFQDGRRN